MTYLFLLAALGVMALNAFSLFKLRSKLNRFVNHSKYPLVKYTNLFFISVSSAGFLLGLAAFVGLILKLSVV